jgi:hypothetical protein
MIIQMVLLSGLAATLGFALLQRRTSRLIALVTALVSVAGMYFVVFPEQTNTLARLVGVGRGADFVLYSWLVISLILSVHLQFKLLRQHQEITELARGIALLSAKGPEHERAAR